MVWSLFSGLLGFCGLVGHVITVELRLTVLSLMGCGFFTSHTWPNFPTVTPHFSDALVRIMGNIAF